MPIMIKFLTAKFKVISMTRTLIENKFAYSGYIFIFVKNSTNQMNKFKKITEYILYLPCIYTIFLGVF